MFLSINLDTSNTRFLLTAKGAAIGITEMFLPSLIVVEAPLITKFIIAVTSVSTIIFFSASVPSILSTDIPIRIRDLVVIWFERTVLSLIIVTPIAYIFYNSIIKYRI